MLRPAKCPQYLSWMVILRAGLSSFSCLPHCDLVGAVPRRPYSTDPTPPVAVSRFTLLTFSTNDLSALWLPVSGHCCLTRAGAVLTWSRGQHLGRCLINDQPLMDT